MMRTRPLSTKEQQQYQELLQKDLDTLYAEFGHRIGVLAPGEDPSSQAQRWVEAQREQLYTIICIEGNYCEYIQKYPNVGTLEIVAATADLLAPVFGGVPINTLAVMIVKLGLYNFCQCSH
jgi:hypothetical protein